MVDRIDQGVLYAKGCDEANPLERQPKQRSKTFWQVSRYLIFHKLQKLMSTTEIGVPILPRFFLVTTQSGVKSMTLSLDGARERIYGPGHSVVECVSAIWTYKYTNGYTVTLRGPLTTHVFITPVHSPGNAQIPQYTLKFDDFQFVANFHEKYIALESIMGSRMLELPKTPRARNTPTPTPAGTSMQVQRQLQQVEDDKKWEEPRVTIDRGSIPGEPVNAFGIPQATMRCLEVSDSTGF